MDEGRTRGGAWWPNPFRPYCGRCRVKLGLLAKTCPLCKEPVGKRQRTFILIALLVLGWLYVMSYYVLL